MKNFIKAVIITIVLFTILWFTGCTYKYSPTGMSPSKHNSSTKNWHYEKKKVKPLPWNSKKYKTCLKYNK